MLPRIFRLPTIRPNSPLCQATMTPHGTYQSKIFLLTHCRIRECYKYRLKAPKVINYVREWPLWWSSHICPVKSVLAYVACRGFKPGPLSCHLDGSPLTRNQLVCSLKSTLTKAGVRCENFSGHSFRIGAATTAAAKGMTDSTIQTLGRWRSDSFKRYIRMSHSELAGVLAQLLG